MDSSHITTITEEIVCLRLGAQFAFVTATFGMALCCKCRHVGEQAVYF